MAEAKSDTWISPYESAKSKSVDEEIENFGSETIIEASTKALLNEEISTTKSWLMRPCHPGDPPVQCYMERHRIGFGGLSPKLYKCYLERMEGQSSRVSNNR